MILLGRKNLFKKILLVKIKDFDNSLHSVLLSLAKRIAADGEGASKFITINVSGSKTQEDAKKIAFSIIYCDFNNITVF